MQGTITTAAVNLELDEIGGLLVTTLEDSYNAIRRQHPEIPPAVIIISSRPPKRNRQVWGHFASSRWEVKGGHKLSEIMISAEGLKRPAREVLATVVHEGAHGLNFARGIKDNSDSGRYHNEDFKKAAEELGLKVERAERGGWTITTLPEGKYDNLVNELSNDLIAYRESDIVFDSSGGSSGGRSEYSYRCSCPRKIRVYEGIFDQGPILCGLCGDYFQ